MRFIGGESKKKSFDTFELTFHHYDKYSYLWDNLYFTELVEKNKKNNKITFTIKAKEVNTLQQFLKSNYFSYSDGILFFNMITQQLFTLDKNNTGILFFDINDIIVVKDNFDNNLFYFTNVDKIIQKKNNFLDVNTPFDKKHFFISPEMKNMNNLPGKVTKYSSCYSLAILTIYGFLKDKTKTINQNTIDETVGFLGLNKLFYSLKRAIKDIPKERKLLYI